MFLRILFSLTAVILSSLLLSRLGLTSDLLDFDHVKYKNGELVKGQANYALNRTKIATMIEPRDDPLLLPTLLNFLAVVPADWPFLIWCSDDNIGILETSRVLRPYVESGKVELRLLPPEANHAALGTISLSRLLTRSWYWSQFDVLAEYVLIFQVDSILCSRSETTVDDWLGYDYVGGPTQWAPDGRGGNGGFSIRRLSLMRSLTMEYEARLDQYERDQEFLWPADWFDQPQNRNKYFFTAEDVFFVHHLKAMHDKDPSSVRWPVDDGRDQSEFSLDIWNPSRPVEQRKPLGIHTGAHIHPFVVRYENGTFTPKSQALVDYCPEVLMLRFALPLPDGGVQAAQEMMIHPE
ncbi:protein of unknown function [Taphrina deformans PYCC 5710]|uniref:DUF5672 domain-containing protein n=1 Tax=Taphrina deformans (strain PYCC 5710 / ATCC 11124 / CBS 356.35 / IMI 108563 / JCM 9778 / NBRC 8474) TaxID=1097556 RepID=R4XF09_TAPDE|nr:protein of unknown function [Taphrina deformans PYCC 5710]|eukprot:CCG84452.1 protein of unknown function [Taphrina deformans PYCC 5710]